ncbi:50S ribosomal protein L25/general stress protein Ctc [Helicobacter sp. 10-6591]|uniref:50S ribosomal protein L25/general stress protein Ctc n=1 Tax=Helicobacter sp. 10-6591 TaxID=2004998 RepID=UPI000DCC31A8|nr:50S ribosomal protein L25/general stress protein Ctc [Helicobacter sp. 10-6591]RAX51354.1 50S ribosomal protein L25/general stress protein Ctc [Helicobacter sp. 10-6591]
MLEGIIRESISKADCKALRNNGYLIANIYGKGIQNIHCAFKLNDFMKEVKNKQNLIFQVKLESKIYDVVVQDYQKDPVTNILKHVDLLLVQKDTNTKFKVPVKTKGNAKGLKNKGLLFIATKRISVVCLPEKLPNSYELDVSDLDVGDSILVRDLPCIEGLKVINKPNVAVVSVIKAK